MMRTMLKPALLLTLATVALTACQSNRRVEDLAYVERPVEQLYNAGAEELDSRDYVSAIALFNEVERQHPYSEWARRSTIMSAYASYRARRYDDAISTAQRYLSVNPAGQGAAYSYYIIAMSYFDQIVDVGRDQKTTELALAALYDVTRRYPETAYARDANFKIDMVRDQLAGKEMAIGRWYLRRNEHVAAINRFETVVEEYDTTSHTPEALHRLVEAYLSMGLRDQAVAVGAVMGYNYGDTDWYQRTYSLLTSEGLDPDMVAASQKRSWLQRLTPWRE